MREVTSFSRTMRAIDADGMSPALLAILLIAGLGGVWTSWLVMARVPVYQLSQAARLEVERVHPVAATAVGRVTATSLVLGRQVQQGDVLMEVEADLQWLATVSERTRLQALGGEATELAREIAAEQQAIEDTRLASRAALAEAEQRFLAAEASARLAEEKFRRSTALGTDGLIATADLESARADQQSKAAELAAARAGIDKLKAEQVAAERDRRGRLASLLRERVNLEGLRAAAVSTVALSEREAERRRIRAPVSGRLGEVIPIQVGAVIREGDRVASIVPDGHVRAVAEFAAPALGRLRPGQPARVRLDGFPWMQYGYVAAAVRSVASETRSQTVRVEFDVRRDAGSSIPLEHGMPGAVEVEVERVPPLTLILRALGHAISGVAPVAEPGVATEARRE
jgi:multidrug resistance efflux pump